MHWSGVERQLPQKIGYSPFHESETLKAQACAGNMDMVYLK